MVIYIIFNWSENYGDANAQVKQSFITAWESIKSGNKLNSKFNLGQYRN